MNTLDPAIVEPFPSETSLTELARAACFCALGDPSPRAERLFRWALPLAGRWTLPKGSRLLQPADEFDLSGADLPSASLRMGRPARIAAWLEARGRGITAAALEKIAALTAEGAEALLIADLDRELGVLALREPVAFGLRVETPCAVERVAEALSN